MFISVIGSGDNKYVYLMRSDRKNGKVVTSRVQSFGKLSELIKHNPNAVEELKAKYKSISMQAQAAATQRALKVLEQKDIDDSVDSFYDRSLIYLNYSGFILNQIWYKELILNETFRYLQRSYYKKQKFNLNKVISALVYLRVYNPSSIKSFYLEKPNILGAPFEDVCLDQLYSCLDILSDQKDCILNTVNRNLDKLLDRKYRMVFYDVTNVYFETALTDEEKNYLRKNANEDVKRVLKKAIEDGILTLDKGETIENYDLSKAPEEIQAELRSAKFFRTKGPSKEHRYDLPLISIAMIIDENAIPVDFEVYSGCKSEYRSMPSKIKNMKEKYGIKDVIVVADRGINSANNLKMLLDQGYGFIVAQKITNLGENICKKIFDEKGYTTHTITHRTNNKDEIETIRRKVINWEKRDKTGKTKVPCKLVVTYSSFKERRDRILFEKKLSKAKEAIQNDTGIPKKKGDWVSLVKKTKTNQKEVLEIDEKAVEKARKILGYSALVYHNVPKKNEEEGLNDREIAEAYRYLVQIEDCFRVMKSNLNQRPVFVWTENHIKGHVCSCILALILLRRMQMLTKEKGINLSIQEIQEGFQESYIGMLISSEEDGTARFYKTKKKNQMYKGIERLSPKTLKAKQKELFSKPTKSLPNQLLKAVGLNPIPSGCDRFMLAKCLNTKFLSDKSLLDSGSYFEELSSLSDG